MTVSETANWLSKISTGASSWFTLFISLSICCCCSASFASRWSLCLLSEAVSVIIGVVAVRVDGGVAGVLVIFRDFFYFSVAVLIWAWVAAFFLWYLFDSTFFCLFEELFPEMSIGLCMTVISWIFSWVAYTSAIYKSRVAKAKSHFTSQELPVFIKK